ncbi:MAG TPA: hypothetical protein VMW24_14375 [Sedimentisphaerales bacterium]|jgi:hypothetical protein|nr:hypothetical protein [Sedimentisphaerales bacterium]
MSRTKWTDYIAVIVSLLLSLAGPVEAVESDKFAASSEFVEDPVAVRYAWGAHPVGTFGNRAGPAVPFRTDDWPAWVDYPFGNASETPSSDALDVPDRETAEEQAWQRKAAQARRVLKEYEAWKKGREPKDEK